MARQRRHKPSAPSRTARVTIEEIGTQGDGVANIDGTAVFVPYTAPGDVVEINFRGQHGIIKDLVESSVHRAQPPCMHFGVCGGCALQHVTQEFYQSWKTDRVVDALRREGFDNSDIIAPMVSCLPASRRRAVFAVIQAKSNVQLGFNRKRGNEIVAISECGILAPPISDKLDDLRAFSTLVPRRRFGLAVTLCDNGLDLDIASPNEAIFKAHEIELLGSKMQESGIVRLSLNGELVLAFEEPVIQFGGVTVAPPAGGFLQASREGEAALIELVANGALGAKKIADLFCGSGTFSLPLGAHASVDAFDSDGPAIEALDAAARQASLRYPVKAHRRNLYDQPLNAADLRPYDCVVFDPPRAGAQMQAGEIAKSKVATVIGVSCNPGSFARDAALLCTGGYTLLTVTPVDQFVFGAHVELVGTFKR